ncbi:MAG TPA: MFS transporter, partial [Geminicoccaceae bacterium]|nr:MFS transporter [Geminicoccaceae bacterium]
LVVLALVPSPSAAMAASLLAGACWIAVVASLGTSVQVALPDWVRARGLSVYVALFSGSMSIGSALWGQTAELAGIPVALLAAALGAVAVVPLTRRWKLLQGLTLDLAPSAHWTAPVVARPIEPDRGPVMVTVEYRIDPAGGADGFLAVVHELGHERRRDGAFAWGVFEDVADPGRYLEYFMVESWVEHLRQHERVTRADRALEERVLAFHIGPGEPAVTHLVGAGPPGATRRP